MSAMLPTLRPGFEAISEAILVRSRHESLPLFEVPSFRPGEQPHSFELDSTAEMNWRVIVDEAFESVAAETAVKRAVAVIATALPATVREADYLPIHGPLAPAARCFSAFCEIALRRSAELQPPEYRRVGPLKALPFAAAQLESFCMAKRHRFVQTAPLLGVAVDASPLEVAPNIVLRSIGVEGRQALWRRLGATPTPTLTIAFPEISEVAATEAVVEVTVDLQPGDTQLPYGRFQEQIPRLVDSLRLLGPGPVRWLAQWPQMPEHERFLQRLFPEAVSRAGPRWGRPPDDDRLRVADSGPIATIFERQALAAEWPENERRVYELAHRRFSQTYDRVSDEDRLIDAWVAFEALFLPDAGSELSYRAQMRIARFSGADLAEREALREQLRRSYAMRSNVVHGAVASRRRPDDLSRCAAETVQILRRALARWIDPATDRRVEALDRALLS